MTYALTARGLQVGYGSAPAVLTDVSLAVTPGRRLAILGANGSGKTTLLRCLAGSLPHQTGEITTTAGALRSSRNSLAAHRRQVQLVLQDPDDQLFAGDVATDVTFGPLNLGLPAGTATKRAMDVCDRLGIRELWDRPIHQLSYGQRKRVALAGAIAMEPRVLLADEPTAGLDPLGVAAMRLTLDDLESTGTAVVLSTHDVDFAWEWADDIAIVTGGRVHVGEAEAIICDQHLLAEAGLCLPWQVQLLRKLGIERSPRPRTVAEVAAAISTHAALRD